MNKQIKLFIYIVLHYYQKPYQSDRHYTVNTVPLQFYKPLLAYV